MDKSASAPNLEYDKDVWMATSAHEKGIVHRDLKPENLFVAKMERIKIVDFALASKFQREVEKKMKLA